MINRRSFLKLVRNRVAAGVLCSGMLTEALEISWSPLNEYVFVRKVWDDIPIYPGKIWFNPTTKFYGVGIAQMTEEFTREVAEKARKLTDGL